LKLTSKYNVKVLACYMQMEKKRKDELYSYIAFLLVGKAEGKRSLGRTRHR
jgi:hypothetical protein